MESPPTPPPPPGGASGATTRPISATVETKSTRMPLFYGRVGGINEVPPRSLVNRIEAYCKTLKKDANAECQELYLCLRGEPLQWWESMVDSGENVEDWPTVRAEFLKDYDYRMTNESAYKLLNLRQKAGERTTPFFARISSAVQDMARGTPEETTDENRAAALRMLRHVQKNLFISGLKESLRKAVLRHPPGTLKDAKEMARQAEFLEEGTTVKPEMTTSGIEEVCAALDLVMAIEPDDRDEEELHDDEIAAINNWRRTKGRKPFNKNFRRRNTPNTGSTTVKCYNCGKEGHISRNCRAPRNGPIRSMDQNPKERERDQEPAEYTMSSIKNW